jgi:membrane protein
MSEPAGSGGDDGVRALVARWVERALGFPRVMELRAVLDVYDRGGGGLVAGGLAYAALFAMLPGLLLALSVVGVVASSLANQETIVGWIAQAMPPLEEVARAAFQQVAAHAVPTGLLAIAALLWGSSRFYTALDQAFARVFSDGSPRNPIVRIVRGLMVTGVLVILPVVLLTVASVVGTVAAFAPAGQEVSGVALAIIGVVAPLGSVALFTLGTGLCYRFVPTSPPSRRAIVLPALVAGVILATFTQMFAFVAPRLVGVAALYGTFVAVFALLAWLSIGFNVLLLGAAWARVRDGMLRRRASASPAG